MVLDPLSVEGSYTAAPTYQVKDLYSGTKTVTPRLSQPQQVDVVPQEVLRDTAATRVERALDYVPGVGKQNDFGAQNLALYSVRGFATQDIFFNGFNIARGYNGAPDTQTCSPSRCSRDRAGHSMASDPGGTINILTKQPVALRFVEMGTLVGESARCGPPVDAAAAERGRHRPLPVQRRPSRGRTASAISLRRPRLVAPVWLADQPGHQAHRRGAVPAQPRPFVSAARRSKQPPRPRPALALLR